MSKIYKYIYLINTKSFPTRLTTYFKFKDWRRHTYKFRIDVHKVWEVNIKIPRIF